MEWSTASPLARQQKLQEVADVRLVDSFFSLHIAADEDPIYISETVEQAMNPNYQFFDLNPCGPSISRSGTVVLKVWSRMHSSEDYRLLIEQHVQLSHLQYLGKTVRSYPIYFFLPCMLSNHHSWKTFTILSQITA
jgi:UV radiation resistance-associated gene protein